VNDGDPEEVLVWSGARGKDVVGLPRLRSVKSRFGEEAGASSCFWHGALRTSMVPRVRKHESCPAKLLTRPLISIRVSRLQQRKMSAQDASTSSC
jgi:hypothetical protein